MWPLSIPTTAGRSTMPHASGPWRNRSRPKRYGVIGVTDSIKQRVLAQLLTDRIQDPLLYSDGSYEPMTADGARGRHCLAFRRTYGSDRLVVVVPCRVAAAMNGEDTVPAQFWSDTHLAVGRGRWRDVLTGATIETHEEVWPSTQVFARLPVAALRMVG